MINLNSIRTLYRQPDTLALWGIPYDMRPGQNPRDLWNASRPDVLLARAGGRLGAMMHAPGPLDDWIYLGCPGWWGSIEEADQKRIAAWLARHAELVPENPCEWSRVRRYHVFFEIIDRHMANYGEKIQLTVEPALTHEEACTYLTKQTPHEWRRYFLVEV